MSICNSEEILNKLPLRKKCAYTEFSGSYFPAVGLNTEICSVNFCIHSECRKIRARKTSNAKVFTNCMFFEKLYNLLNNKGIKYLELFP